ncbi:MAG: DivIVA domain-containing protein [Acidimicrobiales bacterium]
MDELGIGAEEVASKEFPVGFRGFAQHDVRAFLAQVAAELAAARERERLQRERLEAAEARAATHKLTDEEVEDALGHEAGRVLQAAREAASEIRARAEEQVARLVREASGEGARAQQEAEALLARRSQEAEKVADEIRAEAQTGAEGEIERSKAQGREMVAEAQAVRERVLKDLARRRRLAHQQLEQLRAGRERLLEAYRVVRSTLDEATRELSVAEVEARAAAEKASLRVGGQAETTVDELEAELTAARDLGLTLASPSSPSSAGRSSRGSSNGGTSVLAPAGGPSSVPSPPPPGDTGYDGGRPDGGHTDVTARADEAVGAVSPSASQAGGPTDMPSDPFLYALLDDVLPEVLSEEAETDLVVAQGEPPDLPLPEVTLPEVTVAEETVPEVTLPEVTVPEVTLPEVAVPEVAASQAEPPSAPPQETPSELAGTSPSPALPEGARSAPGSGTGGVEELFARLRAERALSVSQAQAALAVSPVPDGSGTHVSDDAGTAPADSVTAPVEPSGTVGRGPARDDEAVLQGRDADIELVERTLVRALKRSLADEQNEVLDTLRRHRGPAALTDLLPDRSDHVGRYVAVAAPELGAAAARAAGSAAAPSSAGPPGRDESPMGPSIEPPSIEPPSIDDLAAGVASEVVDDLRARLERALEGADGDHALLVEGISAAYREWRTSRVEPLARHNVAAAHTRGRFSAAPEGLLRWVVDDEEGPCPDCDDNALAGATMKGEPFPTGQQHPPAHLGCRCTIAVEA